MSNDEDSTPDSGNEAVLEGLDEEKVLSMIEAEGEMASSVEDEQRIQKKLLDDLGLFDVDVEAYGFSEDLKNKVEHLRYVNVESDEENEFSDEIRERAAERLRELGYEPPRDD